MIFSTLVVETGLKEQLMTIVEYMAVSKQTKTVFIKKKLGIYQKMSSLAIKRA